MEKKNHNNWYILFVRGGHEKQVINNIYNSLKNYQLEQQVGEVKALEGSDRTGKIKNLLSSYLFINCTMNSKLLTALYSTQGVIGFPNHDRSNPSKNPTSLSTLEVNNFLAIAGRKNSTAGSLEKTTTSKNSRSRATFETGNLILIREGFFRGHRGLVTSVDLRKQMVTINIDFFGRLTPVSVSFVECERV